MLISENFKKKLKKNEITTKKNRKNKKGGKEVVFALFHTILAGKRKKNSIFEIVEFRGYFYGFFKHFELKEFL